MDCTANYLQLKLRKGCGIFHYEVAFEPQLDSRNERHLAIRQHQDILNPKTFDGVKLFRPERLPQDVS